MTADLAIVPKLGMIFPKMGRKKNDRSIAAPSGLADALFTPVQQRVLGLLFGQPARRFQSGELIRLAGSGTGATHRVLKRWAESGLVRVSTQGNQKYYQANAESPVFEELAALVRKTVGLVGPLREALAHLADRIQVAFVCGSVASGKDQAGSDIDLTVISEELDYQKVFEAVQQAEQRLGRPVNPNMMTLAEWQRRREQADSFVSPLKTKPRLFIIGSKNELDSSDAERKERTHMRETSKRR